MVKLNVKRILAAVLALMLTLSCLAGCGNQSQSTEQPQETVAQPIRGTYTNGYFDGFTPDKLNASQKIQPSKSFSVSAKRQHTVLIYMVGSDLETRSGLASRDLREMMGSGLDTQKTSLVVYAGGSKSWDLNISSAQNTLLQLNGSGNFTVVGATSQAANMGNPRVLADFLQYAYKNFPAERYSLIFWNHGGGHLGGYGSDEQFNDCLGMYELQWAMENSPFKQHKLEMLGFDACLMASVETAAVLSPYTRYFVASEEVENGTGWDYKYLKSYDTAADITAVTDALLTAYADSFRGSKIQYTLSCMDMTKLPAVVSASSALFLKMAEGCLTGDYKKIAQLRDKTKRFYPKNSYDLVDLGHMAQLLRGTYQTQADDLIRAVDRMVIRQVSNVEDTSGVSVYYPYDSQDRFVNGREQAAGSYFDCQGYQLFLQAFASKWIKGRKQLKWEDIRPDEVPEETQTTPTEPVPTEPTPTQPQPTEPVAPEAVGLDQVDPNEQYYRWQIDSAYRSIYSSASYSILRYEAETDTYVPILSDVRAVIDEQGIIYVPEDPYVFTLQTDKTPEALVWYAWQTENTASRNSYYAYNELLASGDVVIGGIEPVGMVFSQDARGNLYLERIESRNEEAELFGKMDVDPSVWSSIGQHHYNYYLTKDAQGTVLPVSKWSTDSTFTVEYIPYEESISLSRTRLSGVEGTYYLQLCLKDIQGETYAVDSRQIQVGKKPQTVYWSTEAGDLIFDVYEDHAELTGFEDLRPESPVHVSIPQTVGGKQVTVIGAEVFYGTYSLASVSLPAGLLRIEEGAFRACFNLKSISLPQTLQVIEEEAFFASPLEQITMGRELTTIGWRAFAATKLTQVHIPGAVSYVGSGAFYGCTQLTGITVAPENSSYTAVDGVLFTKDGKTLVAYPAGAGTAYSIPEGTQTVAAEAFRQNDMLTAVTFPSTLKHIRPLAFCDTVNLTAIDLPAGLETVGAAAFGKSLAMEFGANRVQIRLGANVSWVGEAAFDGYRVTDFAVDEANASYSARDGFLMNVTGTRLVRVANTVQGALSVPDTVNHIDDGAFTDCGGLTELTLPDSVTSVSANADFPTALKKLSVGASLLNWNNLKFCAGVEELVISPLNPNFVLREENVYNGDVTQLLLYRNGDMTQYNMPDTVTQIVSGAFRGAEKYPLTQISLSRNLQTMPDGIFGTCVNLESIQVKTGNRVYMAQDGLLYSADGRVLIAMPMGKTGTVTVRSGTVEIARGAIYNSGNIRARQVIIPEGVTVIRDSNFMSYYGDEQVLVQLPASLTDIHPSFLQYISAGDVAVTYPADSTAEAYVREKGLLAE